MPDQHTRGVVVPFRTDHRAPGARPVRREGSQRSAVGPGRRPPAPTLDLDGDAALNAEWDRLLELTVQACTWRDPESLAAVETVLLRLTRVTLREWSP